MSRRRPGATRCLILGAKSRPTKGKLRLGGEDTEPGPAGNFLIRKRATAAKGAGDGGPEGAPPVHQPLQFLDRHLRDAKPAARAGAALGRRMAAPAGAASAPAGWLR